MKFEFIIDADDNDAMKSRTDVAFALGDVAKKLRQNSDVREGPVLDLTGQRVGLWTIVDDEHSGVFSPHRGQVQGLFKSETEPGTEVRAGGDTVCETCQKPYRKHPYTGDRDSDGNPWLHRLCDGKVVKL